VRLVLQRVSSAAVDVAGERIASIGRGLLVLAGVGRDDAEPDARRLGAKVAGLRIFGDDAGKMNRSLTDVRGQALVVSQFTLYADTRKGYRPSFIEAARPEVAVPVLAAFVDALLPIFWGGKVFYTNADGGYVLNRFLPGLSESPLAEALNNGQPLYSVRGTVRYATSGVDGKPTILITYDNIPLASGLNVAGIQLTTGIRDECRAVEGDGLYLCYTMWDFAPYGPLYKIGFFVLDTKHPNG